MKLKEEGERNNTIETAFKVLENEEGIGGRRNVWEGSFLQRQNTKANPLFLTVGY